MEQAPSKQRRRENFKDSYEHLCAMQNSCPLAAITANLQEDFIDCNADRIRLGDWTPVIDSLKTNNSLRFIAFRSFWQQNSLLQEGILSGSAGQCQRLSCCCQLITGQVGLGRRELSWYWTEAEDFTL